MKFIKKLVFCLVCLALVFSGVTAYANQITIENKSGHLLYIYDFDQSVRQTVFKTQLQDGQSYQLTMRERKNQANKVANRIYFAAKPLTHTLEKSGVTVDPDPTNMTNDGKVMFSFAEYNYEGSRYTVDTSYIDVFSYPITLKFSANQTGVCKKDFEYGPTSFLTIKKALLDQGSPWSDLVWNESGMYRILGPNKIWPFKESKNIPPDVPSSYRNFITKLPPTGHQLFGSQTENFAGWLFSDEKNMAILKTGYVKALRSAARPDNPTADVTKQRFGFYIFPKDGLAEFTDLSTSNHCTITVYPYDK